MTKTQIYLPKFRTDSYPMEKELRSFAPDGSSTMIPNSAVDDITANNIACQEFDYTESLVDGRTNIHPDDTATMTSDYEEYNIMPDNKLEGDK